MIEEEGRRESLERGNWNASNSGGCCRTKICLVVTVLPFFLCSCCFWEGHKDKVSLSPSWFLICLMVVDDLEFFIYLQSIEISGTCHHVTFMWCWGSNLGIHACLTNAVTTELHPKPVHCKASLGDAVRLPLKGGKQWRRQQKPNEQIHNSKMWIGRLG